MRVMMRVKVPVEAGNAALESGALPRAIAGFMEKYKPEAAYFLPEGGVRTAYFFVNLAEESDIPGMGEGFFRDLEAAVELLPVMNAADLRKGLEKR